MRTLDGVIPPEAIDRNRPATESATEPLLQRPVAEDVPREGVGRLDVRRGQHVRVRVEGEPDAGSGPAAVR